MAFGFLKKIPKGIWSGVKKLDDVGDFIDKNIPGGKSLLLLIPVAGPYLKLAIDEADFAERTISGPGRSGEKLSLALERLANRLKDMGEDVDEDNLRGLIETAVRVKNGEAVVIEEI